MAMVGIRDQNQSIRAGVKTPPVIRTPYTPYILPFESVLTMAHIAP